jgi:uncharacterized protein
VIGIELIALAASVLAGGFGALVGVGGGLIIVPLLVALGIEVHVAIGVSLLGVISVSTAGSVSYLKQGFVHVRLGLTLLVATAAGGIVGSYLAGLLDARTLSGIFGFVLVLVALQMLRGRTRPAAEVVGEPGAWEIDASYIEPTTGETVEYRARNVGVGTVVSLFGGTLSGLMGVGGGIVNVPTMNVLMGVPIRVATATSTFMLGATATSGAILYLARGQVEPMLAAAVVVGVLAGATVGARFSRRLPREVLSGLFVIVAAVFSIQMLLRFVLGS